VFSAGDVGKNDLCGQWRRQDHRLHDTACTSRRRQQRLRVDHLSGRRLGRQAGGWRQWRAEDVGKFVRINGGLVKITLFVNDGEVRHDHQAMTSVVASRRRWPGRWRRRSGRLQRLPAHRDAARAAPGRRGHDEVPADDLGQRTGELPGLHQGQRTTRLLQLHDRQPTRSTRSATSPRCATWSCTPTAASSRMQGGIEKPITPTNVRVRPESPHGSQGRAAGDRSARNRSSCSAPAARCARSATLRLRRLHRARPLGAGRAHHEERRHRAGIPAGARPAAVGRAGDGALLSCTMDRDQSVIGWAQALHRGRLRVGGHDPERRPTKPG
jgi:hypothetical protein